MIFLYTHLNLNGGPSKTAIVLSSLPVINLNGLVGLKSHELIGLLWPEISPTDVPVSAMNTWPNLKLKIILNKIITDIYYRNIIIIKIILMNAEESQFFWVKNTLF